MVDILKYQLHEPDLRILGEEIVFKDLEFTPLDYDSLRRAKLHQPIQILMYGRGTILESGGSSWTGKKAAFKAALESRFTSKAIGLVRGGGYLLPLLLLVARSYFPIAALSPSSIRG
ncbi:hypothetical protein [Sinorhizobium meliloti]|uniref:hypothetical protein n=1 Tax=Rhizobium meliloti TaxID=382 RepID=UPI0020915105|nr:hypothetical protein [Sinorhizobium meliloti]MCO5966043.1 hypothetical protein [Sinorhizobium meliloti]